MRHLRVGLLLVTLGFSLVALAKPVRILATGDMHGWLEAQVVDGQTLGGTAEMLAYWQRVERYKPSRFLLVSCGDVGTGPALGTVYQNDPVIAVMNRMGYDASTLGNHEFDYGQEALKRWQRDASFPIISANVTLADGSATDLPPYVINDEQGVKVAVIGLTTDELPRIANTGGLRTLSYAETLRRWVPRARMEGAQVIVVVSHVPMAPLMALAKEVSELKIPLMLGAHSHEFGQMKIGDTWVVNNGEWWHGYTRVDLDYNPENGKTVLLSAKQVWLQQLTAARDRGVSKEIARWQKKMDADFAVPIGFSASGLQRNDGVYNFIIDCWRAEDPQADFALSNLNGFRQDLAAGVVTKASVWGIMPFMNSLIRVALTGEQLQKYLPAEEYIGMSGLYRKGGRYFIAGSDKPVDSTARYHVLMSNYMYDTSPTLQAADSNPTVVFADWREPVYRWLAAHPTSKEQPLESIVDLRPRAK